MSSKSNTIDELREITAWIASFSPFTLVLVSFIVERVRLVNRVIGSFTSIMLMVAALILFFAADKYIRHLLMAEEGEAKLYKKALVITGVGIPILGMLAGLMVGPPDGPFTTFSFMIISLSGIGAAWKRFIDKVEGKVAER